MLEFKEVSDNLPAWAQAQNECPIETLLTKLEEALAAFHASAPVRGRPFEKSPRFEKIRAAIAEIRRDIPQQSFYLNRRAPPFRGTNSELDQIEERIKTNRRDWGKDVLHPRQTTDKIFRVWLKELMLETEAR